MINLGYFETHVIAMFVISLVCVLVHAIDKGRSRTSPLGKMGFAFGLVSGLLIAIEVLGAMIENLFS